MRMPTVEELLTLMDIHDPAIDLKYIDTLDEFQDFGLKDVVYVYSLPVELLVTIGTVGRDGARRLHTYCQDKLLAPLGFLETNNSDGTTASDSEVLDLGGGRYIREGKKRQIMKWHDEAHGCEEVEEAEVVAEEGTETVVGTDYEDDGLDSDVGGMATCGSCEVEV
jgi:hypothetical protein